MPTARQIAAEKRRRRKELERDERKADRTRLRDLRAKIKAARAHARIRRKEVSGFCRRGRRRARDAAKQIRAQHRAMANAAIAAERAAAKNTCGGRKSQARARNVNSLERAKALLQAETQHQNTVKRWTKPLAKAGPARSSRRVDAIRESDSDVEQNIPLELVPVWRVVKHRIKGTARRTRAEAFTEWAAEHQSEVIRVLDEQIQRDVARMVADETQLRRAMRKPSTYRKRSAAALADVPF